MNRMHTGSIRLQFFGHPGLGSGDVSDERVVGPHLLLESINLLVGQRLVHRPVVDAVAVRGLALLGIVKLVDERNRLDEVASNVAHLNQGLYGIGV